ncbi:MAG: PrpF domain-containing protein [Syntrophobacterales bacterium]
MIKLRCVIMRGGTSKAVFFHKNELPSDPKLRDKVVLDVFGSPDIREIDGLGGANAQTSKLSIISRYNGPEADVEYNFGQVMFDEPLVSYGMNCGNISAAVGPFAIDEGLVKAVEPITSVRVFNTNSQKVLIIHTPVRDGKAVVSGDYHIDGVPGTAAKIGVDMTHCDGTRGKGVLFTGNPKDTFEIPDVGEIEWSLVDLANPTVFVKAGAVGLKGTEEVKDILNDKEIGRKMEAIRSHAGVVYGVAKDEHSVDVEWPVTPFSAIVMPPCDYTTIQGEKIKAADMSLRAIIWAAHQYHPAYSGTICASTGVGALIPGTVVNEVLEDVAKKTGEIKIGHPSGIMECDAEVEMKDRQATPKKAIYYRTARRIMEGYVYLKPWTMSQDLHM